MVKHISLTGLALSYSMLTVVIAVSYKENLAITKDIIVTYIKMSLQLFFAGFALSYIFKIDSTVLTSLILLFMILSAALIVIEKTKIKFRKIVLYIFLSISVSALSVLSFMLFGIVHLDNFNAQYVIPLAGMIIGNSMNSLTISIERFFSKLSDNRETIENYLCLGANGYEALEPVRKDAFKSALLPSLSSASGMGIVFLPGMMTGQILSGISPVESVNYQISIVIAILVSIFVSNYIILRLLKKIVLNNKEQLII